MDKVKFVEDSFEKILRDRVCLFLQISKPAFHKFYCVPFGFPGFHISSFKFLYIQKNYQHENLKSLLEFKCKVLRKLPLGN